MVLYLYISRDDWTKMSEVTEKSNWTVNINFIIYFSIKTLFLDLVPEWIVRADISLIKTVTSLFKVKSQDILMYFYYSVIWKCGVICQETILTLLISCKDYFTSCLYYYSGNVYSI